MLWKTFFGVDTNAAVNMGIIYKPTFWSRKTPCLLNKLARGKNKFPSWHLHPLSLQPSLTFQNSFAVSIQMRDIYAARFIPYGPTLDKNPLRFIRPQQRTVFGYEKNAFATASTALQAADGSKMWGNYCKWWHKSRNVSLNKSILWKCWE